MNLVGKFPEVKLSSFSQLLNLFFFPSSKLIIKPPDELRGEKTPELSFKVFKFHVFVVFDQINIIAQRFVLPFNPLCTIKPSVALLLSANIGSNK